VQQGGRRVQADAVRHRREFRQQHGGQFGVAATVSGVRDDRAAVRRTTDQPAGDPVAGDPR
jgi:hypothetical protein